MSRIHALFDGLKNLSWPKKIVLTLVILVLVIFTSVTALVATDGGSRWVVNKVAAMVGLRLQQVRGNLITGLDVASLDYQKDDLNIHADSLAFRWQPLSLFYTTVSVQSLKANQVHIHLPTQKKSPAKPDEPWPNFAQPVRIELGGIDVRNLVIEQGDAKYPINSITGSLVLGHFDMGVTNLALVSPEATVKLNGTLGLGYPYKSALKTQWQYKAAGEQAVGFSGDTDIKGSIEQIDIEHQLWQPLSVKAFAKLAPALGNTKQKPSADIRAEWSAQPFSPELLALLNPNQDVYFFNVLQFTSGNLQIKGWLDNYQVTGALSANTSDAFYTADIAAQGVAQFSEQAPNIKFHLDNLRVATSVPFEPLQVSLQKIIQHSQLTPMLAPVMAPLEISSKSGVFMSALASAPVPAVNDAAKPLPNNFLQLTGDIALVPKVQWDLHLAGEHINTAQFIAGWPSDLKVTLATKGAIRSENDKSQLQLDVEQIDIQGLLNHLPLIAKGEIHFDGSRWRSSALTAAIGENNLVLKGQAGNDLALEWQIKAPRLAQIDPSLRGNLTSNGVLSGDINDPRVKINVQAMQIGWRDYGAASLALSVNPKPGAQAIYDGLLTATRVQLGTQFLTQLVVKADGSIANHKLIGQLQSPSYGSAEFTLSSGWENNLWHGQFQQLAITANKMPRWNLASSTPMQADAAHADIGKLCLSTANALPEEQETAAAGARALVERPEICFNTNWAANGATRAQLSLQAVPLSSFRGWFKPEVSWQGVLEGNANLQTNAGGPLLVDAKLQTRNATLFYQFQGGKVETYPLQNAETSLTIKNNQLNALLAMDWQKYGIVNAQAQYGLVDKKIQAKAALALPDLAPLEGLLPFLNEVRGSAKGNLNIAGTSDKPQVTGDFTLTNGSTNLPKLGLELKNISLQVTSPSVNSAHVEGKITSGDGTLVTQGDFVNLGAPDWYWQANVFGADIRIITQTQLTANISPNLKLHADAKSIELTGSTEIPWARANIKNLPESATRLSHDVVIVEKNSLTPASITKKSIPFHTNVILYFGDDVRFKGFGLDTRLTGKANVLKEENRQLFTTGFVAVDRGVYKAYGQELTVERGRLIFQGPYDNPGLDIRAVRIVEDGADTAGLDIGGTLQHPKSEVFAIPAKSPSEAMAILITGKSLTNSSKADAYTMLGAIGKLGMSQGDSMSADIIHKVGLDEITVKADKGLEQSELWMGKYLTPKLFIRYIVGLFDQAFSLGMTYKINDRVQLQAESGKEQSVDVIYKIER